MELNTLTLGNAMVLADELVDDESIDLILCDPVWWELDQYEWLGKVAMRVLKDGGNLVAQAGTEFRHAAESFIYDAGLIPRPLIIENFSGGFAQMWKHRSLNTYHPYIWATKGETITRERWVHDGVRGTADKKNHEWGDGTSFFIRCIETMTEPGDVVFDPFTGSGTVPISSIITGRNYVAFEVNEDTYKATSERLLTVQRPLFVPQPVQLEIL